MTRPAEAAEGAAAGAASRLSVFGTVASGMQVTKSNDLDLTLELDDVADDDAAGKGRAVEEAAAALDEANEWFLDTQKQTLHVLHSTLYTHYIEP